MNRAWVVLRYLGTAWLGVWCLYTVQAAVKHIRNLQEQTMEQYLFLHFCHVTCCLSSPPPSYACIVLHRLHADSCVRSFYRHVANVDPCVPP